ncbi:MAG: chitobiase/beta-hexosaminidase C-terminal domain-containing protein [Terracidiphilus sp.]
MCGSRFASCVAAVLLLVVAPGTVCSSARAQTNEWVWINGTETPSVPVYGTLGTPAPANLPGDRESASSWTDNKGNLWMFGGWGFDASGKYGYLNELWEYSPSTNEWAWMGGSNAANGQSSPGVYGTLGMPAPGNVPSGRDGAVTWTDATGNLWLFGGGDAADNFNDLWEFNPSTNEWAWIGGSDSPYQQGVYGNLGTPAVGNVPGARVSAFSWTDSQGNFWLFGGTTTNLNGDCQIYFDDLWRFNPSTKEWSWMRGSNGLPACSSPSGQPGIYGMQGVAAATNFPGSRVGALSWIGSNGKLWLFGGYGMDSNGQIGSLNDLWEFDPSTGLWTWVGGGSTFPANCSTQRNGCHFPPVYGTLQVPAADNDPGSLASPVNWADHRGNLWLFGGWGSDSNQNFGWLDDLWQYNVSTGQWSWMSGSSSLDCAYILCGEVGAYGALQSPALGNVPSGREVATGWTDSSGNFWLFGGEGVNVTGTLGAFQDLWEFQPNTGGLPIAATPDISPSSGTYTTAQLLTIDDATPGATIFYLLNGNTPAVEYTGPIALSSSATVEAIAGASGYANSNIATAAYTLQVTPAATPAFSVASGIYSTPQTVEISDATPGATIYYTTDGSMPTTTSAVYGSSITISSSETILAIAVANGYLPSEIGSAVYTIGPVSTQGEWTWMGGSSQPNQPGVYGTLLTPSSQNIPGARYGATSWTDPSGNLWLFGGAGSDSAGNVGYLNDLWEFSSSSNQWTWMGGCTTLVEAFSCTGQAGIYGTLGVFASANLPGGRYGATSWMDSKGYVWIFGGYGIDSTGFEEELNDLWEFDPTKNQWAWMGGSNVPVASDYCDSGAYGCTGAPGVYGALGVPSPGNIPGSRYEASSWVDQKGNLWLFGGTGEDATGNSYALNDLWEFNPSKMEWAWMGGSNVVNVDLGYQEGSYGTLGVASAENYPPSRTGAAAWTGLQGNLWLLGGGGGGANGKYNDLWRYDTSSNEWTWMNGASGSYCAFYPVVGFNACSNQPPVRGTLGLPATGNTPGGNLSSGSWVDKTGNLWLFGTNSSDITGGTDGFYIGGDDDLSFFDPSTSEWTWMAGDYATSNCYWIVTIFVYPVCDGPQGVYGSIGAPAAGNVPGARTGEVTWTDKSGNLWLFSGTTTNTSDYSVNMNDLWKYQPSPNTFPAAAAPVFSIIPGTYLPDSPLVMSNGMANASIFYTTDGSVPSPASTLYSGPIALSSSASIQAIATVPGYRNSSVTSANYTIVAVPATPAFSLASGTYASVQTVTISDVTPSSVILYTTDGTEPNSDSYVYAGPITVATSETINAVAVINGYANSVYYGITFPGLGGIGSAVASATYTIDLPAAATPTFTPTPGIYTSAQSVTLADSTPGASIYYTANGTTPTTSSALFPTSNPMLVSSTTTIEAIAAAAGYSNSVVASGTYTINLAPPSFTLGMSPSSLTLASGGQGNVTLTVTPQNGFNSTVSFACSGLPSNATCSFSPTTVTPSGSAATTQLTIAVSAKASLVRPASSPFLPATGLAIAACFFACRRRRILTGALVVLVLAVAALLTGCGGGGSAGGGGGGGGGGSPQSYTVTVTATSGALQQTAAVTLTEN